jgi:hypothetical protein
MVRCLPGKGLTGAIRDLLQYIKIYQTPFTKIRVGGPNDGGYILLRELCEKSEWLYSFGIGDDTAFEDDLMEKFPQIKVKAFDPYNDMVPVKYKRFQFHKYGLGTGWKPLKEVKPNSILKMDIEWDEWAAVHMFPEEQLTQFRMLVIEFHLVHCEPKESYSPYFYQMYNWVFDRINQDMFVNYHETFKWLNNWFLPFHIHANNSLPQVQLDGYIFPPLLEISFIRRDLLSGKRELSQEEFPVAGLDSPNKTNRPDILDYYPWKV